MGIEDEFDMMAALRASGLTVFVIDENTKFESNKETEMTKKDFQALAVALYEARMTDPERRKLANVIVAVCMSNNASFDAKKFYDACGVSVPGAKGVKDE